MKKFLALILTVAMVASMASILTFAESTVEYHGASFDSFYTYQGETETLNFGEGDGAASDKLDGQNRTVDGTDGTYTKIRFRGWIGFEQELTDVGYQINDEAPVFENSLYEWTEGEAADKAAVQLDANGGAYARRFDVTIPVAGLLGGEFNIVLVAKVGDEVVKLDNTLAIVGAATCPNTQVTYIGAEVEYHGASFDSFYTYQGENSTLNFGGADGNASVALDGQNRTIDITDGTYTKFVLRGWIGFEQELTDVGYQIDDYAPVFANSLYVWNEGETADKEAVQADGNGGAYARRFEVTIPAEGLAGTHTIVLVAKVGTEIVKLDDKLATVGLATCPNTTFTYVAGDVEYHGASFDSFYTYQGETETLNFGEGDGAASDKLDGQNRTIDGSDGSYDEIRFRGWIGFEQELTDVGYQINGEAPVFANSLYVWTEGEAEDKAAVQLDSNGGANARRFDVTIPVADLEGTNEIVLVALVGGEVVKLDNALATVGQATCPNTSVTFVGPAPATADASLVIFVLAACAIALVVLKKKAF